MEKITDLSQQFADHKAAKTPAYQLLKTIITEQINSGHWAAGETIPSENELANALGLSRMTVNRAIREMTLEGLLVRTRGVGTFVAEHKNSSALFEVRNIADEIAERGHTHSSRVLLLEEVEVERVGRQLDPGLGQRVFHSVVLHYDDGVPIQLEERYVNAEAIPQYLDQDFTAVTPNAYLQTCTPITRGTHVVEAVLPHQEQAKYLAISASEACLRLTRTTWSGQTAITQVALLHPGLHSRLEGSFETYSAADANSAPTTQERA